MAATKKASSKAVAIDRKLVNDLRRMLKDQPGVDVVGHVAVPAWCCGNGTVALVKIEKGRPPDKG